MNDKIKELWEEAAKTTQGDSWEEQTRFMEKFAELIVQICANIVRNSSLPDSYSEACLRNIADELEEHFGVKND